MSDLQRVDYFVNTERGADESCRRVGTGGRDDDANHGGTLAVGTAAFENCASGESRLRVAAHGRRTVGADRESAGGEARESCRRRRGEEVRDFEGFLRRGDEEKEDEDGGRGDGDEVFTHGHREGGEVVERRVEGVKEELRGGGRENRRRRRRRRRR